MPLVELIEASRLAVDELIDGLGRASIEAVLQLSAAGVAGEKHQGRKGGDICWHGAQSGQISLSDRKLRVNKDPQVFFKLMDIWLISHRNFLLNY